MNSEQSRWYYLASTMTVILSSYMAIDMFINYNKMNDKRQKSLKKSKKYQKQNSSNSILDTPKKQEIVKKSQNNKVYKIVFTGGPCAGKTTALAQAQDMLRERGFTVFIVPEAATCLATGGAMINLANYTTDQSIKFQCALMKLQMSIEDRFNEIALMKSDQPSVILCDRGVMDGSAYMDVISWQVLLDEMGSNAIQLRDQRYDAIIHLVTAADGASEHYNLDNAARYETNINDAIKVDQQLQKAWHAHPYWNYIDNSDPQGFQGKMEQVGETIMNIVGLPAPIKFYKKFLLKNIDILGFPDNIKSENFIIEDTYLTNDGIYEEKRVRRRGQNDSYSYLLFETKLDNQKQKIDLKRRIKAREYMLLSQQKDPIKKTLTWHKKTVLYNKIVYNFEEFLLNENTFQLMIIQSEKDCKNIVLPEFIQKIIVREITDEFEYQLENIADKQWVLPSKDKLIINQ